MFHTVSSAGCRTVSINNECEILSCNGVVRLSTSNNFVERNDYASNLFSSCAVQFCNSSVGVVMLVNKAGKNTTKNINKKIVQCVAVCARPRHRDTGYDSFGREMMRVPGVRRYQAISTALRLQSRHHVHISPLVIKFVSVSKHTVADCVNNCCAGH